MANLKKTHNYYFTVEGETEWLYLRWLEQEINCDSSSVCKVKISCDKKDPIKYVKSMSVTQKAEITHVFDYEGDEPEYEKRFVTILNKMKKAEKLGKQIKYRLGYSNFSFELWMILHKADCNGHFTYKRHYLDLINRAYEENFENLDQYKHEESFKRVLQKLCLKDVQHAIQRAKSIIRSNEDSKYTLRSHKGYK
jgi:NRPS condensation-like uncharacterized protein